MPVFKNQKELFLWCWEHRPHYSEISGEPLIGEPYAWNFAHVLPKGSFPLFKLEPFNIVLVTLNEHNLYDHQTHKAKADPQFSWLFHYREILTQRYNRITNTKLYGFRST